MSTFDLQRRVRVEEWMDDPAADAGEIRRSLRFIRRINSLLGYTRSTISHFQRLGRNWRPGERIHIIDFATGSGDIPRALLAWGRKAGFDLRIVGVDLHAHTAQIAGELSQAAGKTARAAAKLPQAAGQRAQAGPAMERGSLTIVRADVLRLPFERESFDYAMTSMFLHHLDEESVVQVLKEMNRVARRGVVIADLVRDKRAYRGIKLLTSFAGPMVRHDGPASVAQAFTREEVMDLSRRAGIEYARYHHHIGYRFVLAGEKG